jgi:hypothetical protein
VSRDTKKKNMGIETKVVCSGNRDGQKHPIDSDVRKKDCQRRFALTPAVVLGHCGDWSLSEPVKVSRSELHS